MKERFKRSQDCLPEKNPAGEQLADDPWVGLDNRE
jgi:hypothetical protein